jgi:hypothetical protein
MNEPRKNPHTVALGRLGHFHPVPAKGFGAIKAVFELNGKGPDAYIIQLTLPGRARLRGAEPLREIKMACLLRRGNRPGNAAL